jgi:hypothetical protein
MSEDAAAIDELAERAEAHLHETSLTPEEYETLIRSVVSHFRISPDCPAKYR